MELAVKKAFIDKNDKGKIYKVGETLHTDELNRVNDLVARGICVIKSLESKNAGVKSVTKAIEALSDESVTALKEALEK